MRIGVNDPDAPMVEPRSGSKARGPRSILTPTSAVALVLGLLTAQAMAQGYAPDVAASRMILADGLAVSLYAADPDFRAIDLICDLVRKAGDRATIVGLGTIARRTRSR
jgi:hypothetical protein